MEQSYRKLLYQSTFIVFLHPLFLQVSCLLTFWSSDGGVDNKGWVAQINLLLYTHAVVSLFVRASTLSFSSNIPFFHDWIPFITHPLSHSSNISFYQAHIIKNAILVGPHPLVLNYWLQTESGKGEAIVFSFVLTSGIQWIILIHSHIGGPG